MRRRAPTHTPEVLALRQELAATRERLARLERQTLATSARDPRTGLLDVRAFHGAAARELERTRRSGATVSLVLVDIDGFRDLNAARGAAAGDTALAHVANAVREATRQTDVVGRTGSDELAALLLDTPLDGAVQCAARILEVVHGAEVPGCGSVTVSAGVAQHRRDGTIEALLARAGDGLRRVRRAGGGRVDAGPAAAAAGDEDDLHNPHADVIEALAVTLLERDRYTGEHSESVVTMARSVARTLGLHGSEIERIGAAALLHDIGKVAIPDHILHKPAQLDDEEWVLMREHPVIGWRILQAVPGLGSVARIVRHEHERFDGGGYPDGLAGDAIPVGSRIILACDTYHAMTSDRPYRARMPHVDAVHELARCAGTQFDPKVTEALIGHLYGLRQGGSPLVT